VVASRCGGRCADSSPSPRAISGQSCSADYVQPSAARHAESRTADHTQPGAANHAESRAADYAKPGTPNHPKSSPTDHAKSGATSCSKSDPRAADHANTNGVADPDAYTAPNRFAYSDCDAVLAFRCGMYFQLRGLPWLSHKIDIFNRCCRVSSRFASVSHSTYSFRWLGLKFSNVFRAFAFFASADLK
jgi:hypothetical protein